MGLRWVVGNGEDILFWTRNWVFPFPLTNLLSSTQLSNVDHHMKVSQVIANGQWNRHLLSSMVNVDVVNKICSIPLPLALQSDSCC